MIGILLKVHLNKMTRVNLDFKLTGKNMSPLMDLLSVDSEDRKKINRIAVIWASVNGKRMTMMDLFEVIRSSFPEECQRAWFDLIGKNIVKSTRKWK